MKGRGMRFQWDNRSVTDHDLPDQVGKINFPNPKYRSSRSHFLELDEFAPIQKGVVPLKHSLGGRGWRRGCWRLIKLDRQGNLEFRFLQIVKRLIDDGYLLGHVADLEFANINAL